MKIVHVGFSHRSDDIRIFQKECRSLVGEGYDVTYITSNRNSSLKEGIYDGVRIKVIPLSNLKKIRRYLNYCHVLCKELIAQDAAVYHFHEFVLLPVLAYIRRKGKKVIYDMHEDTPRQMEPRLRIRYGRLLGKILVDLVEKYENYWIKRADYIITATPHIAERCIKLSDTVNVVANYPIINENSVKNPFESRRKLICYTGGISMENGILNIIHAMEYVDGQLLLAGNISDSLYCKLQTYKGWEKVIFLGYINKEQISEILSKSMIGLVLYLPSGNTVDALPNKMFEYMEAGLPVIASDFPSWKEIILDNECGICVNPNDPIEISKAINTLLNCPLEAERLGNNGKIAVRRKYNWGGEKPALMKIYKTII